MTADTKGEINKDLIDYVYANFNNTPKCLDYELMLSGLPYNCFEDTLLTARTVSHENATDYDKIRLKDYDNDLEKLAEAKYKHLHGIFGRIDPTVYIEAPFYVDYGCNISIGKNFFANFNAVFLDCALIEIGDNVLLGPNVTFTTATHPTDPQQRLDGVEYAKPITVGNNVWFGANIVVLPGVTIGDGAVVGAGAIVTKDVPANSVAVGTPAKVIKTLKPADDKKSVAKEVGV